MDRRTRSRPSRMSFATSRTPPTLDHLGERHKLHSAWFSPTFSRRNAQPPRPFPTGSLTGIWLILQALPLGLTIRPAIHPIAPCDTRHDHNEGLMDLDPLGGLTSQGKVDLPAFGVTPPSHPQTRTRTGVWPSAWIPH